MSISASSELMSLCRSQLGLLQSWGAVYSVVYLTEKVPDGVKNHFVPILVYPDLANVVKKSSLAILPAVGNTEISGDIEVDIVNYESFKPLAPEKKTSLVPEDILKPPYEIFLPLIHDRLVMGLLVTARQDRSWNQLEREQIESIAQTLAIACVMEQQENWLKQELAQQQKLQSQQRDILDNLLHQIRSPLTAIRTFGKLLLKRLLPENPNQEIITGIVQQSDRLQELLEQVDACLDLTETEPLMLESQTPIDVNIPVNQAEKSSLLLLPGTSPQNQQLTTEPCHVASIIEPLIVSATAIAQEKQQQVFATIPENLPLIKVNIPALREVLSNIIDNALKYTPAGGNIWVKAGVVFLQSTASKKKIKKNTKPECLDITITDTGYGINSADLDRVFERSYRGVQANTDIPGTGLGLAIAKELIEKMQGKIEVYSPPQSDSEIKTGTSFTIWLPICEKL
ncbi:sensor histidine kinase [Merismopedia glauca]|uniref:histidine kinase n=1 Tax=Merismopedia glauca CCAP 1448/3 TaxID=1296344 RepID=A0A2T1C6D8_9CYAN|nr:HAMP domain-containing sensor histidine kinase [Merismopedia glauca]PSB03703.1 sensor histidine kinase [Merismopedia glauca CCAP 1448/3]